MDNSPYLTILNDGIHNFLLHSSEETLELQDPNLKNGGIFTEIEDVAKEWSVELPVLMEDQGMEESSVEFSSANNNIETTMGLVSNLPNIYEETPTISDDTILENATTEEAEEKEATYPIEVPGKGFITAEGFFITNELLLQFNFGNDEEVDVTNENSCQANEGVIVAQNSQSVNTNRSLLIANQSLQGKLSNINTSPSIIEVSRNIPINSSSLFACKSLGDEAENNICNNWFEVVSAFKCKQCSFLTDSQTIMIQHYKIKHLSEVPHKNGQLVPKGELKVKSIIRNGQRQMIYICSLCNLGYGTSEKLKLHMILSHKLAKIPEELLEKDSVNNEVNGGNDCKSSLKFEEKKKMQMSLLRQQSKASKKIKCSVTGCDLRFALDDMRARHEKCHIDSQKQFKCFECGQKFSVWRTCSLHLWRCHSLDLGLLTCPMCNVFKASSSVRLVNHMAIHKEDKPYTCRVCEKTFKQHSQLINHQLIHKDSNVLPEWASRQQCDICKKYFSNSKCLKKHIQCVHDKFKPFICSVCGHKTARKSMLELHLRQHTGEKPHQCPLCEYKTGDHNSLRRHFMRHSGHTKYSCPHCQYQSIQSTAYKNHIATKHPGLGGSYFCTRCSYHTVNENTYITHLGDHEKGLIKETLDKPSIGGKNYKSATSSADKKVCINEQNENRINHDAEDDESHNYLSLLEHSNDAVDTGGITIPAGFELPPA